MFRSFAHKPFPKQSGGSSTYLDGKSLLFCSLRGVYGGGQQYLFRFDILPCFRITVLVIRGGWGRAVGKYYRRIVEQGVSTWKNSKAGGSPGSGLVLFTGHLNTDFYFSMVGAPFTSVQVNVPNSPIFDRCTVRCESQGKLRIRSVGHRIKCRLLGLEVHPRILGLI